jgi:hypothetical protein
MATDLSSSDGKLILKWCISMKWKAGNTGSKQESLSSEYEARWEMSRY